MTKTGFLRNFIYAITAGLLIFSCTSDGDGPDPNKMNFDLLDGKWSITQEVRKVYDGDGALVKTETDAMDKNMFTIEFLSANMARIIQVEDGMWAEADLTLNEEDSTLSISFTLGDEQMAVTLKILSLSESAGTLYEEGSDDGNNYISTITISKNDSSIPVITEDDLKAKWSTTSQAMLAMVDENSDGNFDEQDEVMMNMNFTQIPYNRVTVEFLADGKIRRVDSYLDASVDETTTWELLDGSNIVLTDEENGPFLIHIVSLNGTNMEALFIQYNEEEFGPGNTLPVKMKGNIDMMKNDGSEPEVSASQLVGSWNITDFVELKDGEPVTSNDGPEGATIQFNENETGQLIMGQESVDLTWKWIDGSNFSFTGALDGPGSEPQTILLNIKSFDSTSGKLNVVEGNMEYDQDSEVLRESQIELTRNS